ncbi:MAG TPA: hypothetical protein VGZ25_02065, partial [Gemmataceae bacterium]|nr:hypothetical protein [Gemmataceae bacterium]
PLLFIFLVTLIVLGFCEMADWFLLHPSSKVLEAREFVPSPFLQAKKMRRRFMIADTIVLAVGSFGDSKKAQQAVEDLHRAGFREDQIAVICKKTESLTDEIKAVLTGLGFSRQEAGYYQEASNAGRTLVVVEAENRYRAAQLILERNGSCNPYFEEGQLEDQGPHLVGYPFTWSSERN